MFLCVLPSCPVLAETEHEVLYPVASAHTVLHKGNVTIDVSNNHLGYIMVRHEVAPGEFLTTLTHEEDTTYQFDLAGDGEYNTMPLSEGDGRYSIEVYELAVPGTNRYHRIYDNKIDVTMPDPHSVFLIPNQYVWFTKDSALVGKSEELCAEVTDDYDKIYTLYDYVAENILYDYIKAVTVKPGYIPDADETLATGRGICFDFSVLLAGMLRQQGIPTKLVIGKHMSTNPPIPHAWTKVYVDGNWMIMDATLRVDAYLDPDYMELRVY